MLSSDLDRLAHNVRRLHREGTPITRLVLEAIAMEAVSLADRAREMERHTVPFAARQDADAHADSGGNVVPVRRFAAGDVS